MSHTVYDCSSIAQRTAGLKHAARALAADACVVLPTDTVYGIGANAFSARGVATLLAAKGRSRAMPPPVLIAHAGVLDGLADEVSDDARALAQAFWPGGLTLIFHSHPSLGWDLGETHGTVALRVPDDELAQALLIESGPLAVSSANRTGHPAASTAQAAAEMLGDSVELYLDGGPRPVGGPVPRDPVSSTIVDCTGETPLLVRHGTVSLARLRSVVPSVVPADGDEELGDEELGHTPATGIDPADPTVDPAAAGGSHAVSEPDPEAVPPTAEPAAAEPAGGEHPDAAGATDRQPPAPGPARAATAQGLAAALVARSAAGTRPAVDQDRTRAARPGAPGEPRPLPVDEAARLVARGLGGA